MSKLAVIVGACERQGRPPESGPLVRVTGLVRAIRNDVVDVVHRAGIARKVARLRPLVVVKG